MSNVITDAFTITSNSSSTNFKLRAGGVSSTLNQIDNGDLTITAPQNLIMNTTTGYISQTADQDINLTATNGYIYLTANENNISLVSAGAKIRLVAPSEAVYVNKTAEGDGDIYALNFFGNASSATEASTIQVSNTNANSTHYLAFCDTNITGQKSLQTTTGISLNPNLNSISATTFNGNLNGQVNLITASNNASYSVLVADANTGFQSIKGSGSDLNYNPITQTLSVKNMIVSGNETQNGIITTNVLKTDIMIQQVSYFTLQINTIANFTALLALGTFMMSLYDSGSTIANSIITINLPALPNDGSYDGYTFQLRKMRGGVNVSTTNWTITAPTSIIIINGNTLNAGSGGANSTSNVNSMTQRYTIATYNGIGYYVGCTS